LHRPHERFRCDFLAIDVGMVPDIDVQYRESFELLKKMAAKYGV
jgi:hypothetical protein